MTTSIGQKQSIPPHEKCLILLNRCLQEIREANQWDSIFAAVQAYLPQVGMEYHLTWFLRYDDSSHLLVGSGGHTTSNNSKFLQETIGLTSGELLEQVVVQMRPIIVPDIRTEKRGGRLSQLAQGLGIQGCMIMPLRSHQTCHGLMVLGSERWGILAKNHEKAQIAILAGEMAVAMDRLGQSHQTTHHQSIGEPLTHLLNQVSQASSFDQRLEITIGELYSFIAPERVSLYWFEGHGRYFWPRLIMSSKNKTNKPVAGDPNQHLEVRSCPGFYQALAKHMPVEVAPTQSSLTVDITTKLLEQLQSRSLLAFPLVGNDRLYGFLMAEEMKARVWRNEDKQFLQAAAQMLAMNCGLERVDQEVTRSQANQTLITEVGRAIRSEQDWTAVLKSTAERLLEHLQVERVLLLAYQPHVHLFTVAFQHQGGRRKDMPSPFPGLTEVDWRMVQDRSETIAVEDLDSDLRFLQWRNLFLAHEVKSLLACRTTAHLPLEGLLIVTHQSPRNWSKRDTDMFQVLAHQLGVLLHQWQLQQDVDQQKSLYQTLQWGLTTIQQIDDLSRLEKTITQSIAQLLHAPLSALLTWQPRRPVGNLVASTISNPKFQLKTDLKVPVQDVFIQQILATDGILHLQMDQLLPDTLQWLNSGGGVEQVLGLALRTNPEDEPLGVMIVADQGDRFWSERTLSVFGIFVNQLAWFRRSLLQIDYLRRNQLKLRQLNWYKQFRIIELRRSLELAYNSLNALSTGQTSPNLPPKVYYQQALGQVNHVMGAMVQILRQEQWQLQFTKQTTSLASYVKRSLERIDPLVRQRHLWLQVHIDDTTLELTGDIPKLEGILYQVLVFACGRCQEQGRIDLWGRLLDANTLDLSITDNGTIEPRLLAELQNGPPQDALTPSALEQQPGMLLFICQRLLQEMGGSLEFYYLEDQRVMTRLVLPFVVTKA